MNILKPENDGFGSDDFSTSSRGTGVFSGINPPFIFWGWLTGCLGMDQQSHRKAFLSDFALKDNLEFGEPIVVGVGIFVSQ